VSSYPAFLCAAFGAAIALAPLRIEAAGLDAHLAGVLPVAAPVRTYESWTGADAFASGWSVYGGLTAALFGDVRDSGWRLRSSLSLSSYRYTRSYWDSARQVEVGLRFDGRVREGDIMLGYQQQWGPLTLKLFAGIVDIDKVDRAEAGAPLLVDDENGLQGTSRGARLALETWTRLGDWGFLQADASWSQPLDAYSTRVRLGYRLTPHWSTGLEAAAFGNPVPDQGRAGAFLRFEWSRGEASLSAGAAGDDDGVTGAFATLGTLIRF